MIRITQAMQTARILRDQQLNLMRMDEYSKNMSDGTTLHRPSDDPIRVARALRLKTELRVNETYKANLEAASSWTSKTDDSLRTLSSIIARVRDLTIQAANGTLKTEDKQKAEAELKELKAASINIANDDYMGRYQFSGYKTDKKFIKKDGYLQKDGTYTYYNKDDLNLAGLKNEKINYNIGVGQKTNINITGIDVFGNEYFTTKTRAIDSLPFSDEPTSVMGASMNIKLQKYKQPDKFYDKKDKYTQPDAAKEDKINDDKETKYEKTTKLDEKDGDEISIDNINFYGTYKKGDINQVVEDLNASLRKRIDEKFKDDPKKAAELKQSVQFVNADGKIQMVTDHNYAGKIEPSKIKLSEVKMKHAQTVTPEIAKNGEIPIANAVNYTDPTKAYFNFDIDLTDFKRIEDVNSPDYGDIDTSKPNTTTKLENIVFANSYPKGYTKEQVQELVRNELQSKINDKLLQKGLSPDIIKVVIEGGQPKLIVNREYKAQVTNTPAGVTKASANMTGDLTGQPTDKDPSKNPKKTVDTGITVPNSTDDLLVSFAFDMKVEQPKKNGEAGGDILISEPNKAVNPNSAIPKGESGFLKMPLEIDPNKVNTLTDIGITKIYSRKNADGTQKSVEALRKEIATDIENKINQKVAGSEPRMALNPVTVKVDGDKIKLEVDGNVKYTITPKTVNIPDNTFSTTPTAPHVDSKKSLDLPIPIETDKKKDTHVYMDLNMDITNYPRDEKGNIMTSNKDGTPFTEDQKKSFGKINIDEITLNKTYPRVVNGVEQTDDQIKKQIFDDVKKAIEDKLGQLNPPLPEKAINITQDGDNIKISVYPDIELTVSSDTEKPESITADTGFIPKQTGELQPEREMMPYFEMLDRIMKFMDEGNSKGLSRMLDVVDYYAKNNQKNQGIGGGKTKMYDIMIERTQDVKLNYTELLSNTQDTDYSEMVMRMSLAQHIYRASLSVSAKLMQPSLVDFLR